MTPFGSSVWNQGSQAARAGVPAANNPHLENHYDFVVWLNGWAWTRHMVAKEEETEEL